MLLKSFVFNALVFSKTDEEFLESLDEIYENRERLGEFISTKEQKKTPNDLLKEIFFITEQLKEKLENGEKFVDPEMVAQLAFYKSKAKEKDESK